MNKSVYKSKQETNEQKKKKLHKQFELSGSRFKRTECRENANISFSTATPHYVSILRHSFAQCRFDQIEWTWFKSNEKEIRQQQQQQQCSDCVRVILTRHVPCVCNITELDFTRMFYFFCFPLSFLLFFHSSFHVVLKIPHIRSNCRRRDNKFCFAYHFYVEPTLWSNERMTMQWQLQQIKSFDFLLEKNWLINFHESRLDWIMFGVCPCRIEMVATSPIDLHAKKW